MSEFARTTCACPEDVAHCKRQPGPLVPGDIAEIAVRLVEMGWTTQVEDVAGFLQASPGSVVMDRRTGRMYRVPTITPRQDSTGRCVFLNADDRCEIHEVAPYGCSHFDAHMSAEEAMPRSIQMHVEIMSSPAYQGFRAELPAKGETPR